MKVHVICSGGLDSVSLAWRLAHDRQLAGIISFDYGQRHKKELDYAARCAETLNVPFHCINISSIGAELKGSALTDDIDVPEGHYEAETMKLTVVPNRNAIFLTIAFGIAAANKADAVAIAVHGGDHYIYPDCRPDFLAAFAAMENLALEGTVKLLAPYAEKTKADIVMDGAAAGTPFAQTWSCYKGGAHHCGRCSTCIERREAFTAAGVEDPTIYEHHAA
ncbi:MAG: 7-cyano-7-deazaguanine synthase [Candidatus Tokpelaia hoelldobleri]|uniref:7-cyano-7-deazaguanine synthase n=1 Tax=Candidatus Tokpelaia hoelldobleri TaxID=1902579 RepID=A0A1U9JUU2_9HYPH|nr:MAG: 7-cyano-7-deazaguanine synthase [Candidatus Tokpelaia hoelldoblerii]